MQVKVFKFDKNGKVSFTQEELEKLLNEVYTGGYNDGKRANNYWTWTSPYWTCSNSGLTLTTTGTDGAKPYITWITSTNTNSNETIAKMETDTVSNDSYSISGDTIKTSIYAVSK